MERYKILMYAGRYVDYNRLGKGIYSTNIPTLFSDSETMENLVKKAQLATDMTGKAFISESYIDNLLSCLLVDFELHKI